MLSIATVTTHCYITMLKLKPYISKTQCPFSISDQPLPFPISTIHTNSRFPCLRLSQSHPSLIIVCAKRRAWSLPSNRKILQLASAIAFNLKILPEPLNSVAGEIARGECEPLNRLVGGGRGGKIAGNGRRMKKSAWFVLALVCVVCGWWSWKVREIDLFLRAVSFCVAVMSFALLWLGKKGFREGILFGIVLILSLTLRKEDAKFWGKKLVASSPVTQIVTRKGKNKNRNRNWRMFK